LVIDHHGQRAPLLKQRGDAGVRFRTPAGGWLESARDCQSAAFLGHPSSSELSFTHIFLTLAMGKPCFSTLRHLATACDGRGGGAEPKTRGVAEKRDSALRVPGVNGQGGKKRYVANEPSGRRFMPRFQYWSLPRAWRPAAPRSPTDSTARAASCSHLRPNGAKAFWPERPNYDSPGQRPGKMTCSKAPTSPERAD
jgi:hypothetical protein